MSQQQPVPIGVPGEIYVGGAGVAAGVFEQAGTHGGKVCPSYQ